MFVYLLQGSRSLQLQTQEPRIRLRQAQFIEGHPHGLVHASFSAVGCDILSDHSRVEGRNNRDVKGSLPVLPAGVLVSALRCCPGSDPPARLAGPVQTGTLFRMASSLGDADGFLGHRLPLASSRCALRTVPHSSLGAEVRQLGRGRKITLRELILIITGVWPLLLDDSTLLGCPQKSDSGVFSEIKDTLFVISLQL